MGLVVVLRCILLKWYMNSCWIPPLSRYDEEIKAHVSCSAFAQSFIENTLLNDKVKIPKDSGLISSLSPHVPEITYINQKG